MPYSDLALICLDLNYLFLSNIISCQVSLWDGIIPAKEHARFWIHTTNKYRFIDQVVSLLSVLASGALHLQLYLPEECLIIFFLFGWFVFLFIFLGGGFRSILVPDIC